MGTQATLVALPFQVYVQTRSPLLTGLLGAAEIVPLVALALVGGALADRFDRRRLLLADQVALVAIAGALWLAAVLGHPPVGALYVLAGLLAGFGAIQNVTRSAIIPNVVAPEHIRSALAVNFGLYQLTMVLGPGLGGLLISAGGVQAAYLVDAVSCAAMVGAALAMAPQVPHGEHAERAAYATIADQDRSANGGVAGIGTSIAEGLRFVRGNRALLGSFAIDLVAMTFGMPRALFPVLAVGVYGAGAAGTGVMFAAVSAGATVAALTTRWLEHVRRLGLIVIGAVIVWGGAIALAGVMPSLWPAARCPGPAPRSPATTSARPRRSARAATTSRSGSTSRSSRSSPACSRRSTDTGCARRSSWRPSTRRPTRAPWTACARPATRSP